MTKTPEKPNQDDLTFSLDQNLQEQEIIVEMIKQKSSNKTSSKYPKQRESQKHSC